MCSFNQLHRFLGRVGFLMILLSLTFTPVSIGHANTAAVRVNVNNELGSHTRFWGNWGSGKIRGNILEPVGENLFTEIARINQQVPGSFRWQRSPNMYGDLHAHITTPYICDQYDQGRCISWHGVYREDTHGNPVYDWSELDKIYQRILDSDMKPIVELGFMPRQLLSANACKIQTCDNNWYMQDTCIQDACIGKWGQALIGPPDDWGKWQELVRATVNHLVQRFGREEVESWYFEVWNEPEYPEFWYRYSQPADENFLRLYDFAVAGAVEALPTIRIGGLGSAGHNTDRKFYWLTHLLSETNFATGTQSGRADFYSYHRYDISPWSFVYGTEKYISTGRHSLERVYDQNGQTYTFDRPVLLSEYGPATNGLGTGPNDSLWMKSAYPAVWYMNVIHSFFLKEDELNHAHYTPAEIVLWMSVDNGGWGKGMVTEGTDPAGRGFGKRPLFNAFQAAGMLGATRVDCQSDELACFAMKHSNDRSVQLVMYRITPPNEDSGIIPSQPALNGIDVQINNLHFTNSYDVHYYIIDEAHSNAEYPDPMQIDNLWVRHSSADGSTFQMTLEPVQSNAIHMIVLGEVLGEEGISPPPVTPTPGPSPTTTSTPVPVTPTPTPLPETRFIDVPREHWAYHYVELLASEGYVVGCSTNPPLFCPDQGMNRSEGAVLSVRGEHGAAFVPPVMPSSPFSDVAPEFWGHAWITQLYNDEMTAGCGTNPLRFCPLDTYTIAHAAVFGLRINKGSAFAPPSASGIFDDVDPSSWYAPWVEEAYRQELILACDFEMKRICPEDEFKRDHAAYMLVQALELDSNP